jgi:hypothetical protein
MRLITTSSILILTAVSLFGQPGPVQQYEGTRFRTGLERQQQAVTNQTIYSEEKVPEIVPGETADIGPQLLLRAQPRRQWVQASVDSQYYYTSNAFLTEEVDNNDNTDTGLWVNTAEFAIAPSPFDVPYGQLYPRLGFRYQWYNYGMDQNDDQDLPGIGLNALDFDVQTVFTDLTYRFLENWSAAIGFEWNRFLGHESPIDNYSEFYKEYVPWFGIERQFPLFDGNAAASVGYSNYTHFTNVDPLPRSWVNDRMDHNLTVSYTHVLFERLGIQPFYRFQYTDYWGNGSRNDFLHTFGTYLSWTFNEWVSLRTFASYDIKESHDADEALTIDYHKLDTGGGLNLTFRY